MDTAEQVGREERKQDGEADEGRRGRQPPTLAEQAGERHHDQEREADEQELAAEAAPAGEEPVEVALPRDPVAPLPPEFGEPERHLDEPDEAEAEHAEQHPGADRTGRGLPDQPCAPRRIDGEHSDQGNLREQEVDSFEAFEARRSAELAGAEVVV
ncbi:MAG: hypothetical protein E6G67_11760 [Actinobacteria bacterium]|nr:MAG: hypothetical protein E6G67_11760 [Actinomycetota bacterium]